MSKGKLREVRQGVKGVKSKFRNLYMLQFWKA